MNPFKVSKDPEEMYVMREREREINRLNLLKKRLLLKNDSFILNKSEIILNPESSRNGDLSMVSISNHSYVHTGRKSSLKPGYLDNKRDRSGVIRFIKEIKENRQHRGLRSISELRQGGRR